MVRNRRFPQILITAVWMLMFVFAANGQNGKFTYQGKLSDGPLPANGTYEMQFRLHKFADEDSQLGTTLTFASVQVVNGIFTVALDFNDSGAFIGDPRFVEISVRKASDPPGFTVLSPRQEITKSPQAVFSDVAQNATFASTASIASSASNVGGQSAANVALATVRANGATPLNTANQLVMRDANGNFSGGTVGATNGFDLAGTPLIRAVGTDNLSVGTQSGESLTSGFSNTFLGKASGRRTTEGNFNVFVGASAGFANTLGFNNTFVGFAAGSSTTTGGSNSFFGSSAGLFNTGSRNSFFGTLSGRENTTGSGNSFFGAESGRFNKTGTNNAFFGESSGLSNGAGSENAFFGANAGFANTIGERNTYVGADAGRNTTEGVENIFIGFRSGVSNTLGSGNIAIGIDAGSSSLLTSGNVFIGTQSGRDNTEGGLNTFVGSIAGVRATGGANTFLGTGAGSNSTSGSRNTFVGQGAGRNNLEGSNNTALGDGASVSSDLEFATAIGANAVVTTSNTVVIGRPQDTITSGGKMRVNILGASGSTSLCRNASNEISTCTAGNISEAEITNLRKTLEEQQRTINALKALLCKSNPTEEVCKEQK